MYDRYRKLRITRAGKVLTVTMDNPPLNSADHDLHDELSRVFYDIALDPDVALVVLTGEGKAFSAGGDIAAMNANLDNVDFHTAFMRRAPFVVHGLLSLDKVVIARINGHAMGFGASLALLCDITVASEAAKIADPHVLMGLSAGDGGALAWPQHIGLARARWYLLTGEALTAREAADIGLINKAVPRDQLDEVVDELASRLANGPSFAINTTKRTINLAVRQQAEAFVEASLGLELLTIFSHDHKAAVRAFLDKTTPTFRGD